jgi:DnaJ like chaperone protein
MGIGKWIGGVLGFMAFGPLGALAGIILGSFFEEGANMTGQSFGGGTNYDDEYIRRDPYAGERNSFLFSMLVMASYIIRADGKIMHSEMEYVRQFLRRNFGEIAVSQGEEILLKLFDQAKRMDQENNMGFKNTIRECGTQIAYNLSYEERLQLLAFLAEIAKSDGNVCAAEINALKEVAMAMGMSDREVESMLNLKGSSLDDAYKVLEIEPTATDEEVRAAYRRMAVKHHPDKVASLGEDIRKAANEKFQKINEAKCERRVCEAYPPCGYLESWILNVFSFIRMRYVPKGNPS